VDVARFDLARGRPERAVAVLAEAVRDRPDALDLRVLEGRVLLTAGDRAGWRRAVAELLDRYGRTTDPSLANDAAWIGALGPEAMADPGAVVHLAEIAVERSTGASRGNTLNTLSAALYRAGRFAEAIRRLDEGIQLRGGNSEPQDWAFLAMAHLRLGHRDEARRWLDQFRNRPPVADPAKFWDELEIRLLRSEAEAVVLDDPAFPDDPFAP
jgi:Flp pilus assembly protein TadD